MSKQRKWQPLQDWVLRKWQLILYTARKPFLHGLGVYSNRGGPGKNHTHRKTQSGKDREKMVVSSNPQGKNHRKHRISGYLVLLCCGVGNYGPLFIFGNCSAQWGTSSFCFCGKYCPESSSGKGLGKDGFLVCAVVGRVFNRIQQEKRFGRNLRCCIFCWEGSFPNDLWRIWFKKSALKYSFRFPLFFGTSTERTTCGIGGPTRSK